MVIVVWGGHSIYSFTCIWSTENTINIQEMKEVWAFLRLYISYTHQLLVISFFSVNHFMDFC